MAPPQLRIGNLTEPLISVEDAAVLQEEQESALWTPLSVTKEAGRLLTLAIPLSIQYVFAYITLLISTAFCGHLGSFDLSVAVLSTSIYNVMGNSILIGFSSAIETLCGMAYGAKNYSKMGILLQRAVIITSSVFVVICAIWLGMEPLLRLAGQEPQLAHAAAKYLHLSMPALFANGCINCVLQRYLQAQGIVFPITVAIGIIAILSPLYMYFFIYVLDLGLWGAPLGTGANNFSIAFALLVVTCYREYSLRGTEKQMWNGWSRRAFKGLGTYLSLAVPSTGMICLEWWAFEIVVLMAGNLQPKPELAVAVMGVCMNLNAALYMVPRGMSGAASTRVSNELGAGRPKHAKQAAWMAVFLGGASSALLGLGCYLLRVRLVRIFTTDPEVLTADLNIFHVMCATIFTDGVNVSIEGVIRGSGKQSLAAAINVVTYWGIGIVSAWYFAFPLGMRVAGFWWSRLLATSVQMVVMLVVLLFLYDWDSLAEMAVAHIAAATPRAFEAVEHSKLAFSRASVEDGLPQEQLPPPPPHSQIPPGTTAVSIRRRREELQRTESDALSATPHYSYTSHVTMGGSFAAR